MPNKKTIDLDVLSPFIEDIIMSNLNGTYVITIDRSDKGDGNT